MGNLKNQSEWNPLADFLSNMIAKYLHVLDVDEIVDEEMVLKETSSQNIETEDVKIILLMKKSV